MKKSKAATYLTVEIAINSIADIIQKHCLCTAMIPGDQIQKVNTTAKTLARDCVMAYTYQWLPMEDCVGLIFSSIEKMSRKENPRGFYSLPADPKQMTNEINGALVHMVNGKFTSDTEKWMLVNDYEVRKTIIRYLLEVVHENPDRQALIRNIVDLAADLEIDYLTSPQLSATALAEEMVKTITIHMDDKRRQLSFDTPVNIVAHAVIDKLRHSKG